MLQNILFKLPTNTIINASLFDSKTSLLSRHQASLFERQNEDPMIQGENISDLIHHLDTLKFMGTEGIHPKVLRELLEVLSRCNHLPAVLANQGDPS